MVFSLVVSDGSVFGLSCHSEDLVQGLENSSGCRCLLPSWASLKQWAGLGPLSVPVDRQSLLLEEMVPDVADAAAVYSLLI